MKDYMWVPAHSCPMCGLPIQEGRCPGGCAVEIKNIRLTELPSEIAGLDIEETEDISIIDKSDSKVPLEKQFATLRVIYINAEEKKANWQVTVSSVFGSGVLEYMYNAVFQIIATYLYYSNFDVEKLHQKWKEKRMQGKKHMVHLSLTKNQHDFLKKAAEHFGMNVSLIVDIFTFEVIEMQASGMLKS